MTQLNNIYELSKHLAMSLNFITSLLQLKLDPTILFEWQKHDQDSDKVSGYEKFLEFINLRAQASECLLPERSSKPNPVYTKTYGLMAKRK